MPPLPLPLSLPLALTFHIFFLPQVVPPVRALPWGFSGMSLLQFDCQEYSLLDRMNVLIAAFPSILGLIVGLVVP